MSCLVFVIALALPSVVILADDSSGKAASLQCNATEVTDAGDNFFKCFKDMVDHSQNPADRADCEEGIEKTLLAYTTAANTSCYKDESGIEWKGAELNELMEYSLQHESYKDFVSNGGAVCISGVKDSINECVKSKFGVIKGFENKYYKLWREARPANFTGSSCKSAEELKKCTLDVIRKHKDVCGGDGKDSKTLEILIYVNSLFEYMLQLCALINTKSSTTPVLPSLYNPNYLPGSLPIGMQPKGSNATTGLLAVILTLVLVSMLYVVIRDYRSSRKSCKQEFYPMTSRNTESLVRNESGQCQ